MAGTTGGAVLFLTVFKNEGFDVNTDDDPEKFCLPDSVHVRGDRGLAWNRLTARPLDTDTDTCDMTLDTNY